MAKRALQIAPDNLEIQYNCAHVFYKTGKYQDARHCIELVLAKEEDHSATTLEFAGDVYLESHEKSKAAECWSKAIKLTQEAGISAEEIKQKMKQMN